MELILTLVLGAFVGWVASLIMRTDAEQGWVLNIVVGVVGSFVGQWLSRVLTGSSRAGLGFDVVSLLWAIGGAVLLLAIVNLARGRSIR